METPENKPKSPADLIDVTMQVDAEVLQDMQYLQAMLCSPNLATALYNAVVVVVNRLYDYKIRGYEVLLVKGQNEIRLKLPTGRDLLT